MTKNITTGIFKIKSFNREDGDVTFDLKSGTKTLTHSHDSRTLLVLPRRTFSLVHPDIIMKIKNFTINTQKIENLSEVSDIEQFEYLETPDEVTNFDILARYDNSTRTLEYFYLESNLNTESFEGLT